MLRYELYIGKMRIATSSIIELYRWAIEYASGTYEWAESQEIYLIDLDFMSLMNWKEKIWRFPFEPGSTYDFAMEIQMKW